MVQSPLKTVPSVVRHVPTFMAAMLPAAALTVGVLVAADCITNSAPISVKSASAPSIFDFMLILSLMRLSLTVLWVTVLSIEPCRYTLRASKRQPAHIHKDAPLGVHVPEYTNLNESESTHHNAFSEAFSAGTVREEGQAAYLPFLRSAAEQKGREPVFAIQNQ